MQNFKFNRLFSLTMNKNLKLKMAEMSFYKDFINDTRGDLYPILSKSDDLSESLECNTYVVKEGFANRFLCRFFPYASYDITIAKGSHEAGFCFNFPSGSISVTVNDGETLFKDGENIIKKPITVTDEGDINVIITCRPYVLDVYQLINGKPEYIDSFKSEKFCDFNKESVYQKSSVSVIAFGKSTIKSVYSYIDNGLSTADIRPIKYENGDVLFENGRVYLTASIRLQEEMFQGVFSWVPETCEFELCGALFYNCGDGYIWGDVAASLLYHRQEKMWYLWVCAFSHNHILGHAKFEGEPRFGVNIIDLQLMTPADEGSAVTDFVGFEGDEDPDFYFDEADGKWKMAICRMFSEPRQYVYTFFESDNPFDSYKCIGHGIREGAQETGGSFVKIDGERYFVCGNSFNAVSDYRIYGKDGFLTPQFDYPDGGYRGWGSIIPVKMGTRTKYYHITFDRHNCSDYNWSYGNIYCFEMEK